MPVMMVMAGVDEHETTSIHDRGAPLYLQDRRCSDFVLHFFNLSFRLNCLCRNGRRDGRFPIPPGALRKYEGRESEAHGAVRVGEWSNRAQYDRGKYADSTLAERRGFGLFLVEDRARCPGS